MCGNGAIAVRRLVQSRMTAARIARMPLRSSGAVATKALGFVLVVPVSGNSGVAIDPAVDRALHCADSAADVRRSAEEEP
jgi:hypothetical protein